MFPIRFLITTEVDFELCVPSTIRLPGPNTKFSNCLAKLNLEKCISIVTILQCGLDLNGEFKKSKQFVPFVANRKFHACRLATRLPCVL